MMVLRRARIPTFDDTALRFIRPSRCGCVGTPFASHMRMANSHQAPNLVPFPDGTRPKLLDQVRHAIRTRHYSRRTEKTYADWIRRFIIFHHKKHPSTMGAP